MAENCPICHVEPESHQYDEFWVIGCSNADCPLSVKRSKYRYPNQYEAEEDWDALVEAYRAGSIRF